MLIQLDKEYDGEGIFGLRAAYLNYLSDNGMRIENFPAPAPAVDPPTQ